MEISSVSNKVNFGTLSKNNNKNVSFGSIYLDSNSYIGLISETLKPPKFPLKDELIFNEVSQLYPNQDCFIKSGDRGQPILQFREKPVGLQVFDVTLTDRYAFSINPEEENNPCVELILTKDDDIATQVLGYQHKEYNEPSLATTIKAGFEVHKKILEKKLMFMKHIGKGDIPSLGPKSIDELSHDLVRDVELAVKRHVLEAAYSLTFEPVSASLRYGKEEERIEYKLGKNRNLEMTTSATKRPLFLDPEFTLNGIDICKRAMELWPDYDDNKERIDKLLEFFKNNGKRFTKV